MCESNTPETFCTPHSGFEGRGAHQDPSISNKKVPFRHRRYDSAFVRDEDARSEMLRIVQQFPKSTSLRWRRATSASAWSADTGVGGRSSIRWHGKKRVRWYGMAGSSDASQAAAASISSGSSLSPGMTSVVTSRWHVGSAASVSMVRLTADRSPPAVS